MFELLQIAQQVQIGDSSGYSHLWNIVKDFAIPIGIAILAAWGAYKIFILESRRDRQVDLERQDQEKNDKLLFFSNLVESCISVSTRQNELIKLHAEKIEKNNKEFHLLNSVSLNDLKRTTEKLNLQDYLLAYTNHFQGDRKASVKEFTMIMNNIDTLYLKFLNIISIFEKTQLFDHERRKRFEALYNETGDSVSALLIVYARREPETKILEIQKTFSEKMKGDNYNLETVYEFFFKPMHALAVDFITTIGVSEPTVALEAKCRNAITTYEEIVSKLDILRNDFIEDHKTTQEIIGKLIVNSGKLLKAF